MARCPNCGAENADSAQYCASCGRDLVPSATSDQPVSGGFSSSAAPAKTDSMAVASLVLGIVGIFCLIPGILAVIFGTRARKKISADPSVQGEQMAKWGVILGWIGIALNVIFLLVRLPQML